MRPSNEHELTIARVVDKFAANGELHQAQIDKIISAIDLAMTASQGRVLVEYVRWRIENPLPPVVDLRVRAADWLFANATKGNALGSETAPRVESSYSQPTVLLESDLGFSCGMDGSREVRARLLVCRAGDVERP